ncbi:MAG: tRNA (guanosine(46)-N7)-methyltransferase TrmB [bacterium]|nr:tRNA (guanosine(46)-N7)-methyltransferase TrmB [bacterium]
MEKIAYEKIFPDNKFLDFEIGFGRGVFAKNYAKFNPDRNLIAIEIRKPVVKYVKEELKDAGLKNLYLLHGKAEICLEDTLADASLDRVFLFHPDPWLKLRHHKRRVLQHNFLDLIFRKLKAGGRLYLSTDVENLWQNMSKTIKIHGEFMKVEDQEFWQEQYITYWHEYSKRSERPLFYAVFKKQS